MNYEWIQSQAEFAAAKLGVASEQVWALLVAKSRIDGVVELGYVAFGIFILCMLWKGIKFAYKKMEESKWDFDSCGPILFITSVITVVGLMLACSCINDVHSGLVHTIVPEYGALELIQALIKGK